MNKSRIFILMALVITTAPVGAFAADEDTHSVYRVTSYHFGESNLQKSNAGSNPYGNLIITGTQADVLGDMNLDNDGLSPSAKNSLISGFSLSAEYAPTSNIALIGSDGITTSNWEPGAEDTHSSWEANLGIIYKIFNNVSYGVHFGYMDTGDVYREKNSYSDVESVIMVSNQLSLSF